jgi:hypothetical protein
MLYDGLNEEDQELILDSWVTCVRKGAFSRDLYSFCEMFEDLPGHILSIRLRREFHRAVDSGVFDSVVLRAGDCFFNGRQILRGELNGGEIGLATDADLEENFRRVQ